MDHVFNRVAVAATVTITLVAIGLAYFLLPTLGGHLWSVWTIPNPDQERCRLVVGILSGRHNGQQREHIRRTWLSPNYGPEICIKFVVGSKECPIPPEDRLDIYGCDPWIVSNPGPGPHFFSEVDRSYFANNSAGRLNVGVRLKVLHPIVVDKLGILTDILQQNDAAEVLLLATDTQEVLSRASFTADQQGSERGGFSYRPVESFYLPKYYEVTIICTGPTSADSVKWNASYFHGVNYDFGGNVIIGNQVFDINGVTRSAATAAHLAVSFSYTIYVNENALLDLESLLRHLLGVQARLQKWILLSKILNEAIRNEATTHRDVVMVETVDTYRNLPQKLLLFYAWLTQHLGNVNHVIKMDDDSIVNVQKISELLKTSPDLLGSSSFWWGRFRHHWSVQNYGKWLENDYSSCSYPPFACGVASLLSINVVQWLSNNQEHLHNYQGEDTSMGIWLAALKPIIIEDDRWQCDENCLSNSLSRGQLDKDGIEESWQSLQMCGQLCNCFQNEKSRSNFH